MKMPWGTHKDKPLHLIPTDYLKFVMQRDRTHPDPSALGLMAAIRLELQCRERGGYYIPEQNSNE
jgi:uncharacterized protein (DUF3820 family)